MRRFVQIFALSLILLLVMMASALTAMRYAIHGREVKVLGVDDMKFMLSTSSPLAE